MLFQIKKTSYQLTNYIQVTKEEPPCKVEPNSITFTPPKK